MSNICKWSLILNVCFGFHVESQSSHDSNVKWPLIFKDDLRPVANFLGQQNHLSRFYLQIPKETLRIDLLKCHLWLRLFANDINRQFPLTKGLLLAEASFFLEKNENFACYSPRKFATNSSLDWCWQPSSIKFPIVLLKHINGVIKLFQFEPRVWAKRPKITWRPRQVPSNKFALFAISLKIMLKTFICLILFQELVCARTKIGRIKKRKSILDLSSDIITILTFLQLDDWKRETWVRSVLLLGVNQWRHKNNLNIQNIIMGR